MRYTSRKTTCLHPVKKDTICKEFPQTAKGSPGSFPEVVVRRFSLKEMLLRISQNSPEIPPVLESFHHKVVVLHPDTLFKTKKKQLQHRSFPMNFAEFSRTAPGGCLAFHYFKRRFSLCISFCRIL